MAQALPPLNALRAFEVAARHLNFTKAALELHVTPAAVSHQIRTLENYLGFPLFVRLSRRLELSVQGEALLPVVQASFREVAVTVGRLRREVARPRLVVRVPPYLSAWWLTPRLGDFIRRYPDVDLNLGHSIEPVDFNSGEVDFAIHWTGLDARRVTAEPLLTTSRVPMCSKSLLIGHPKLKCPADIKHFTLLHEFNHHDWERWYSTQGLDPADARRGIVVDNYEVLFRATIEGHGMALLMSSICTEQIAQARLVTPLGREAGCEFVYFVLYPVGALLRPMVRNFRQWLFEQARVEEARGLAPGTQSAA